MSSFPRHLTLAATAVLVVLVLACARSRQADETPTLLTLTPEPTATSTPKPTPTPVPLDPETVLRKSGEVMNALEGFHFRLYHERGSTQLLPQLYIDEAEGDVIKPDKISIMFEGRFGERFAIRSGVITLGEESYLLNPLTEKWEATQTGVSPLGFFHPGRGIEAMLSQVSEPRQGKPASEKNKTVFINGTTVSDSLAPLLGPTLKGETVQLELTIDSQKLYLLEARILGKVTAADVENVVRVITLSAFNAPITIAAPR